MGGQFVTIPLSTLVLACR